MAPGSGIRFAFSSSRPQCSKTSATLVRTVGTPARLLVGFTILSFLAGCVPSNLNTDDRRERGLVIVLPGIEGPSVWNRDLVLGLDDGGVDCAIERYDWGTPVPGGFLINLADIERNRAVAAGFRDHIVAYMDEFPNRPVVLVGHSGGAGMALLAAERMPRDRRLTALVLLAAAVGPDFDLRGALAGTRGE